MKKIYLILLLFLIIPSVYASKIEVALEKCVDGDTAWFIKGDEKIKVRFLAIDAPESFGKVEPYGKEARKWACDELSHARTIELEYDKNSDKKDKYDRDLAWVFVDGELFQSKIVKKGYAKVAYIYGDYLYTEKLYLDESLAKKGKINIWSDYQNKDHLYLIIIIVLILFYMLFPQNQKMIKTYLDKYIKKLDE